MNKEFGISFPFTINTVCFVIGMIGVWQTTHNWWAMLWAFIASLHFTIKRANSISEDSKDDQQF